MISSYDPNITIFNVSCEEYMKTGTSVLPQNEVARKVLVLGIRLDDLVAFDSLQDLGPRNVPSVETHVDVIGPIDPPCSKAILDEHQNKKGEPCPHRPDP